MVVRPATRDGRGCEEAGRHPEETRIPCRMQAGAVQWHAVESGRPNGAVIDNAMTPAPEIASVAGAPEAGLRPAAGA